MRVSNQVCSHFRGRIHAGQRRAASGRAGRGGWLIQWTYGKAEGAAKGSPDYSMVSSQQRSEKACGWKGNRKQDWVLKREAKVWRDLLVGSTNWGPESTSIPSHIPSSSSIYSSCIPHPVSSGLLWLPFTRAPAEGPEHPSKVGLYWLAGR